MRLLQIRLVVLEILSDSWKHNPVYLVGVPDKS
jgi:hypothetical protein